MKDFLHQALLDNGYTCSTTLEQQLVAYLELMQQWNKVFNLTAITDPKEMVLLHILDSLAIHPYLHGTDLIDVGTGAGLPGIPLALLCPEKNFTLLDSNSKKTRFLTQVVHTLGIKNVTIVHSRCESFHPTQQFDSIITRAFATLKSLILATKHLLRAQGQFLAMKGIYPEAEIADIPAPFQLLAVHELKINGLNAHRHLICIGREGD